MKKINITYFLFIVMATLSFSCGSDDEGSNDNESGNFLRVDDVRYEMERGILEDFGETIDGVYDWDISLIGGGFTFNNEGEASGTGEGFYIDLRTENENGLSEGTYIFDNDIDNAGAFSFVDAEVFINFSAEDESGTRISLTSGSITISGTGSNQVITINLVDSSGNPVTGRFEGSLQRS